MTQADKQWEILGYDTRLLGKTFLAGWRDFLWGEESPLKIHLDEAVRLEGAQGQTVVQSGREIASAEASCEGVLLPDSLVLAKTLELPLAAEVDLPSLMAMEVVANSPFPRDDTSDGWRVAGRTETQLRVQMVIVSTSSVMEYIGKEYDIHDPREREIWAACNGDLLPLTGFGEHRRMARYRGRLQRVGAMVAAAAGLLLLISGVAAAGKYLELGTLQENAQWVQKNSREASRMREELASANETILAVNRIVNDYPNPHLELERLTRLLGDEAYLAQWTMRGRNIKLRGRSMDAAAVMQVLTEQEAFAEVTAPQAMVRIPDGQEQFYLNITLAGSNPE